MTDGERQLHERINSLENKIDLLLSLIQSGSFAVPSAVPLCPFTFAEWLLHWQEKYKRPKQSPQTQRDNLARIQNSLIPALGDIKLTDLTADHIQDFINGLPVSNARDKLLLLINGSLRKAHDLGHILRNPYKAVESEKSVKGSFAVIQPATQLRLLKLIKNPKYLQMFMFYCCTGFRFSEALHINPSKDIDQKRKVIVLTMPDQRTKKHKREVPYLPELLDGFDLTAKTLFPDITAVSARQYFKKLFKRYNLDCVIHSFRHTFISCCYHVGIPPKHIQLWAGHATFAMTMDTYTHILESKETPILDYLKRLKTALKL